ncbi:MAG: DNA-binding response regulator [Desulfurivibrio sp.]|nr:MAG: DNA-binding response regulator [Desulfurivibrio sp.]
MNRILVIDDDTELCELLIDYLQPEGFAVSALHQGQQGLALALAGRHDLVVLDVMLPGMNGFEVLRQIRAGSTVPVLMLTARGEEIDRIIGLEMGADDYLPKPFNPRELLARIRAIQRRSKARRQAAGQPRPEKLTVGDISLDPGARSVLRHGAAVALTAVEFSLLAELLKTAGQVVSREELTEKVLDRKLSTFDRSIDVHVSSLRKKLGHEVRGRERIKTIRGVGYLYTRSTP